MDRLRNILNLRKAAEETTDSLPALMAKAEHAIASIMHGEHAQRKHGVGDKFWQFKEYQQYDRPQDIDWRQSAKSDAVYTRQREYQTMQHVTFWCSDNQSMEFSSRKKIPQKEEIAKTLTLALAILMTRAGEQVSLLGNTRAGRSEHALQRLAETLCHKNEDALSLPDISKASVQKNCFLIQVGDFLNPLENIKSTFSNLSMQAGSGFVIQVLDPAEIKLPYSGRAIFKDHTDQHNEQINSVSSIRAAYQKRMKDHCYDIKEICDSYQWGYILHQTDQNITDTLFAIWDEINNSAHGMKVTNS